MLGGTAIEFDDKQARIIVQGRVLEGSRVEVTLRPSDGQPRLRAMAIVLDAPSRPMPGNRYELLLEFERAPEPLHGDANHDSAQYNVGEHVRQASQEIDADAVKAGIARRSGVVMAHNGQASSEGDAGTDTPSQPFRAKTGAHLQEDPQFRGGMLAHLRFRRPDTFVYAYRSQLCRNRVWISSVNSAPKGTPVRIMFLLPGQPTAFRASGTVTDESAPPEAEGAPGVWVKLDKLPKETQRAFDTAVATFAPEQVQRRSRLSFLRLRRRA